MVAYAIKGHLNTNHLHFVYQITFLTSQAYRLPIVFFELFYLFLTSCWITCCKLIRQFLDLQRFRLIIPNLLFSKGFLPITQVR